MHSIVPIIDMTSLQTSCMGRTWIVLAVYDFVLFMYDYPLIPPSFTPRQAIKLHMKYEGKKQRTNGREIARLLNGIRKENSEKVQYIMLHCVVKVVECGERSWVNEFVETIIQ